VAQSTFTKILHRNYVAFHRIVRIFQIVLQLNARLSRAFSHIAHARNRRSCRHRSSTGRTASVTLLQANADDGPKLMEWYHEGSHPGSRAGHADLGAELCPTRLLQLPLVQLFAG